MNTRASQMQKNDVMGRIFLLFDLKMSINSGQIAVLRAVPREAQQADDTAAFLFVIRVHAAAIDVKF